MGEEKYYFVANTFLENLKQETVFGVGDRTREGKDLHMETKEFVFRKG